MTIDALELLDSPLFKRLSAEEVEQFLAGCEKRSLPAWSKIFEAGETKRVLYVLLQGSVEILLDGLGDQPAVLAELKPGDVFGEASFFHEAPHHSTALCTSDVVLWQLSRLKYEELLQSRCTLALRVGTNAAEILAARLQAMDEWVQQFLTGHHEQDWHAHLAAFRQRLAHPPAKAAAAPGFAVGGGLNSL